MLFLRISPEFHQMVIPPKFYSMNFTRYSPDEISSNIPFTRISKNFTRIFFMIAAESGEN